jgi:hypothetical protein
MYFDGDVLCYLLIQVLVWQKRKIMVVERSCAQQRGRSSLNNRQYVLFQGKKTSDDIF